LVLPELQVRRVPALLTARWSLRVIAVLFDQALLGGVAYLASTTTPVGVPSYVPLSGSVDPSGEPWTHSGWVVTTVVAMFLMQAFLGSTPGKLFVGIAVVREADGRPAGPLRTAGRLVLHVLDAILLIGYLRPLWHVRRQTFADSLAGTVVLITRRPSAYRLGVTARREPDVWEASARPGWHPWLTWVSAGACLSGAMLSLVMSGTGPENQADSCSVAARLNVQGFAMSGGTVEVDPGWQTESRMGIERRRETGDAGIRVRWDWNGTLPQDDVLLTATFSQADGTEPLVVEHRMRDGVVLPGVGDPLLDGSTGVLLPLETTAALGEDWTWSLTTTVAGETSPACRPYVDEA
jgi:Mce-associated membrane protein